MLEVCKKCIEIFILLKTIEKQFENVWLFAIAFPSRGCCKNQISHPGTRGAHFFLCSPQCVGITIYMNFGSPSSYSIWAVRVPQIRFRVKFVFQDLLCETAHYFYSTILVLEWGRLFFIKIIEIHLALQIPIWKRSRGQKMITFIDMLFKTVIFPFDINKIMVFGSQS